MNKKTQFFLMIITAHLLLAGCSSAEDKVFDVFKCAKAATLLEQKTELDAALRNGRPLIDALNIQSNKAQHAMLMGQRFQDEFPLYKYQLSTQIEMLRDLFESKTCQALYR